MLFLQLKISNVHSYFSGSDHYVNNNHHNANILKVTCNTHES